ncbi:AmmeMemoRadiSam system protein B [Aestuariispira insulae]|uniref:MEMO1 family protein DFP90_105178 n=1 Tax=Aestuariispira insulae TaxID=1461337 RepID=A0A3D9HLN3_9PROT|nr:AmmeMemoRadiSam system protein B [Aestuariispira insulae]RED49806.1 hypothetical protein DFP90_105178 [Aestuariispira insulae]
MKSVETMSSIRPAALAGHFYPATPEKLSAQLDQFLASDPTMREPAPPPGPPKALIVPHAGYIYSGACAGRAYQALLEGSERIRRVVLLGPCHRVPITGLAITSADVWQTPLGPVPIDQDARNQALELSQVSVNDLAHEEEHSLEVHLPFLQKALSNFSLVPLAVGAADNEAVAQLLDTLWGGPETLIVISTDLSHFLSYEDAQALDRQTAEAIEKLNWQSIGRDQACGRIPVSGMLSCAKRRGMSIARTGLCNSGDTAGTKDRVVGYGSWSLFEPQITNNPASLVDVHTHEISKSVIRSILSGLKNGKPPKVDVSSFHADLQQTAASFVTLETDGRLRGCIGSVTPHRPLIIDIVENAYAAAFNDHRFPPLEAPELTRLSFAVSVLSPMKAMKFKNEEDLLSQLIPGETGLMIQDFGRRSVFLPQVWESLPEPAEFLTRLKIKAGLAEDHWSDSFQAWQYRVEKTAPQRFPAQTDLHE